jgi:hypothetical protein
MMKFGRRPGSPGRRMFGRIIPRHTPADAAEGILKFLGDGKLHDLSEIAKIVDLPERDTEKVLDFLMMGGLVEKGVRITGSGFNLLKLPV